MTVYLEKLNTSAANFMRICGYARIENPYKNNEISYARSLDPGRFYPRFHVYLKQLPDNKMEINLHLDMKKPSYEGAAAHSGEYEGELVKNEILRIQKISKNFISQEPSRQSLRLPDKKSFWRRIFGL